MKKTIEEMKAAVIAECERLCPNLGDNYQFIGWKLMRFKNHWSAHRDSGPMIFTTSDDNEMVFDFRNFDLAYKVLGLEARDAVEAEREEMMKTVDALNAMVSVDPSVLSELEAERAKSAKLVEALETVKSEATNLNVDSTTFRRLSFDISDGALEFHKEGGVQG